MLDIMAIKKNTIELKCPQPAAKVKEIHKSLKDIVQHELNDLPALLEGLTPPERVKTLLALLPYVSPKIEVVKPYYGED